MDKIKPDKYTSDSPIDGVDPIKDGVTGITEGSTANIRSSESELKSDPEGVDLIRPGVSNIPTAKLDKIIDAPKVSTEHVTESIAEGTINLTSHADEVIKDGSIMNPNPHSDEMIHEGVVDPIDRDSIEMIKDGSITSTIHEDEMIHEGSTENNVHQDELIHEGTTSLGVHEDEVIMSGDVPSAVHEDEVIHQGDVDTPVHTDELIRDGSIGCISHSDELIHEGSVAATEHEDEKIHEGSVESTIHADEIIHEGSVGDTTHPDEVIHEGTVGDSIHADEVIHEGSIGDSTHADEVIHEGTSIDPIHETEVIKSADVPIAEHATDLIKPDQLITDSPIDKDLPIAESQNPVTPLLTPESYESISSSGSDILTVMRSGKDPENTIHSDEIIKDGTSGSTEHSTELINEGSTPSDTTHVTEVIGDGSTAVDPTHDTEMVQDGTQPEDTSHETEVIKDGITSDSIHADEVIAEGTSSDPIHETEKVHEGSAGESVHETELIHDGDISDDTTHETEMVHEGVDPDSTEHETEMVHDGEDPVDTTHETDQVKSSDEPENVEHVTELVQDGIDPVDTEHETEQVSEGETPTDTTHVTESIKDGSSGDTEHATESVKDGTDPESTYHDTEKVKEGDEPTSTDHATDQVVENKSTTDSTEHETDKLAPDKNFTEEPLDKIEVIADSKSEISVDKDAVTKIAAKATPQVDAQVNRTQIAGTTEGHPEILQYENDDELRSTIQGKIAAITQVPFVGSVTSLIGNTLNDLAGDVKALINDKRYQVYLGCQLLGGLLTDKIYGLGFPTNPTQMVVYLAQLKNAAGLGGSMVTAAVNMLGGLLKFNKTPGGNDNPAASQNDHMDFKLSKMARTASFPQTDSPLKKVIDYSDALTDSDFRPHKDYVDIGLGGVNAGSDDHYQPNQKRSRQDPTYQGAMDQFYKEFCKVIYGDGKSVPPQSGPIKNEPVAINSKNLKYWTPSGTTYTSPFQGRKSLAGFSLDNSALWDIAIKPYKGADNGNTTFLPTPGKDPFAYDPETGSPLCYWDGEAKVGGSDDPQGACWLPAISYNLSYRSAESKDFEMSPGVSALRVPTTQRLASSMTISIVDDQYGTWSKYFFKVRKRMTQFEGLLMAPYKNLTYQVSLFVLDPAARIRWFKVLLVTLDPEFTTELSGDDDASVTTISLNFQVVGEIE